MRHIIYLIISIGLAISLFGCDTRYVEVKDDDIQPGDHVVWTSDKIYILNELVFVDNKAKLTIEPGTVIKAMPGKGYKASALVVARGGQIFAEGTSTRPIIFTALEDNVDDPHDMAKDARGLWGGIILLGNARVNTVVGMYHIEGIRATDPRAIYGGNEDDDSSGILRYVSIRYGGSDIGNGNEINGLTMGAVGRGTIIDHVEVINNKDDGFEWFGGCVDAKHLVSAFNGDDAFDVDQGYHGRGQFWLSLQNKKYGHHTLEIDGGTTPVDGKPYAIPEIRNSTFIGPGKTSSNVTAEYAIVFNDNAGGKLTNCLFLDFPLRALFIEDINSRESSRQRLDTGDLFVKNSIFYDFGSGNVMDTLFNQEFVREALTNRENNNHLVDPLLLSLEYDQTGKLDPRPRSDSPVYVFADRADSGEFFEYAPYIGAMDKLNWAQGWTALSQMGYFSDDLAIPQEESAITQLENQEN